MNLRLKYGRRALQIIIWAPDRWGLAWGHWPSGETRERCDAVLPGFGFFALLLGPIEFRYWPHFQSQ